VSAGFHEKRAARRGGKVRKRILVALSGASGAIYGIRLLELLKELDTLETHLIISPWAEKTIAFETDRTAESVRALADRCYDCQALDAPPASGSFRHGGMVIVPASMKTVAGIACGFAANLILRAADVTLKEQRRLVLVPRETPLHAIHLDNLRVLAGLGACILPPVPAFYTRPRTLEEIVDHTVGKILEQLGLEHDLYPRWASEAR
jgi:4-hydroxy-3-polyprenylbenzoate decarboxylase